MYRGEDKHKYQYTDNGIEAIAPNLAKTISDMDRVL